MCVWARRPAGGLAERDPGVGGGQRAVPGVAAADPLGQVLQAALELHLRLDCQRHQPVQGSFQPSIANKIIELVLLDLYNSISMEW